MTGAALVAVGSELLRSARRDTNSDWLRLRLNEIGIEVRLRIAVEDEVEGIAGALRASVAGADLVIVTGGLGPTADDRTRDALASALARPLALDPDEQERLATLYARRGRRLEGPALRQAWIPAGALCLENPVGSVSGLWLDPGSGALVVALPGVPEEMRAIFDGGVLPRLAGRARGALAARILRTSGPSESEVDERLRDLYDWPDVDLTLLAGPEGVELQLRTYGPDAGARLAELEREAGRRLGPDLCGAGGESLPEEVGRLLVAAGCTAATAESCTAGLLAAALTRTPGASAWFRGGLVAYADAIKVALAGVAVETLERHGSVSEPVARALARGARTICRADFGLGLTGIAGPGGGSPEKPVGRVHLAIEDGEQCRHWERTFPGDREVVRQRAVAFALDRLRRELLGAP